MADGAQFSSGLTATAPKGLRNRLMASDRFQTWAARFPFTRALVRREGQALFDVMAGFCHSQILMALAELNVPEALLAGPRPIADLAQEAHVPEDRFDILMRGGAAIGMLKLRGKQVQLTRQGAAFATVPGLSAMVRHHRAFYRDLENPVAFFRGETTTELAEVWPYVFGNATAIDATTAAAYSDLMAQSQRLVAQDTLRMVRFDDVHTLMDVGGGTGAFLEAVGTSYPDLSLRLFDLPTVAPAARDRFEAAGMTHRSEIVTGSFRDQDLPTGANGISLVRVLYDHSDTTVRDLLAKAFAALPKGGRIIISEPMSGGDVPDRATDAYFALYTMAMRTGRTRSAQEISALLVEAGFDQVAMKRPLRSYVTGVVSAIKPK
ncbi:methyltransferase [Pseudooctadecabacter jejudonensis]|uniref:Demethylspheroidene O-methyltransferase n=1 Tax=Pseudooctadecabacter jejudonensis TaxID=1391910 RepID=A0A1Y5S5D5_9RHOB|nr:methyltransferase [Pseudooctadecabacter jejudonensis]SLN32879.1 Demethylspheroidene O-methyltransferase [Pseudooctadecabacter jejudonensis]